MTHPHDQAPAPLTAEVVAEMQRDMAAGTPGPWKAGRTAIGSYGPNGFIRHILITGWDDGQGKADSRRIARLPDLEAGYLALATQLAEREKELARVRCPIGLDSNPMICSAGSCQTCLFDRAKWFSDELDAANRRIATLTEALEIYADCCDATETTSCGYDGNLCCKTARAALTTDKGAAS